jgi:hypothetical protein
LQRSRPNRPARSKEAAMDVYIVELSFGNERLDLLATAMRDACRVAGISQRATEMDDPETSRLRLQMAKTILEEIYGGEFDPVALRVAALRSTMYCCVSDGELRPSSVSRACSL